MRFEELVAAGGTHASREAEAETGRRPGEDAAADAVRSAVLESARRLAAGELLVHPTSTLYGLGARVTPALDAELARLKGRPAGRPFVRLASDTDAVRRAVPAAGWCERAERLAREFWPGALTLVLEDGTEHGMAVRVDGHPLIRAVLEAVGELMSSTSVNRSGEPPATGPREVRRALERLPEGRRRITFLNAGSLPRKRASTIVSLRGPVPRLLRPGAVSVGRLERQLGRILVEAP